MRIQIAIWLAVAVSTSGFAHHPDSRKLPVRQPIDVIGPLGNRLPAGYRRTYNRPSYLTGKIAYLIAPTSQEAMAWHNAEHRGDYDCDRGRVVPQYFYAKPYEALRIGARTTANTDRQSGVAMSSMSPMQPITRTEVGAETSVSNEDDVDESNPLLQKLEINDLGTSVAE